MSIPESKQKSNPPEASPEVTLPELFAQHERELLGTLYYLVGNAEDARDALQEAFVRCWRCRGDFPEIDNPKAWVFRIALNIGRDIRKSAWSRRRRPLPEDEEMLRGESSRAEAEASRREQLTLVREALQGLRGEEQEVFLLRQNGDLTYEEIATAMEIPVGTVKTRMRLALKRLRERLAPR